jgi:hypothetical protein
MSHLKHWGTRISTIGTPIWCLGLAFLLGLSPQVNASVVLQGQQNVLPQPCATDPNYQEFERIQRDAYLADQNFAYRTFLSKETQKELRQKVVQTLRERLQNNTMLGSTRGFDQVVDSQLAELKLPTCYENAALYFMIEKYAHDVETARRELRIAMPRIPKFGSLPSNDINAYTYPSSDGIGSIIAINAQLLTFIHEMSTIVAGSVNPSLTGKRLSQAEVITQGLLAISYDEQTKAAFVKTIVGLLFDQPLSRRPPNLQNELLIAFVAGAMERFVFAHEYGHVINRDTASVTPLPVGATGGQEYDVKDWTWKQEFKADDVGLRLLAQLLLRSAEENLSVAQYYVYALKAPLIFFECLQLLDDAKFMQETGRMHEELTPERKSFLRQCVANALHEITTTACSAETAGTHPPAWLRAERAQDVIRKIFGRLPQGSFSEATEQKGDEIVFNLDLLWRETRQQILDQIKDRTNRVVP